MNIQYIVAIVPPNAVESLEVKLRSLHVGGIPLKKVKGFVNARISFRMTGCAHADTEGR